MMIKCHRDKRELILVQTALIFSLGFPTTDDPWPTPPRNHRTVCPLSAGIIFGQNTQQYTLKIVLYRNQQQLFLYLL